MRAEITADKAVLQTHVEGGREHCDESPLAEACDADLRVRPVTPMNPVSRRQHFLHFKAVYSYKPNSSVSCVAYSVGSDGASFTRAVFTASMK